MGKKRNKLRGLMRVLGRQNQPKRAGFPELEPNFRRRLKLNGTPGHPAIYAATQQ
jgi:hypothetical protein